MVGKWSGAIGMNLLLEAGIQIALVKFGKTVDSTCLCWV